MSTRAEWELRRASGSDRALRCWRMEGVDFSRWEEAAGSFAGAERAELGQGWREELEDGFAEGHVRMGWREGILHAYAWLKDEDIYNEGGDAARLGKGFLRGDLLEFFFWREGEGRYFEIHVTPGNERAVLVLAEIEDSTRIPLPEVGEIGGLETATRVGEGVWEVLLRVPLEGMGSGLEGWRFSVSRYDWTRGRARPVLSSTSRHGQLSFHRRHEWTRLLIEDGGE